jgi:RHS repeat-associated protein
LQSLNYQPSTLNHLQDGDWAILEQYTTGNVLVEKYLQGYHGLVKTFVSNVYYYQDELGSTSHVASSTGALLEYYKYDLYGKPQFFDALNHQLSTTNYSVVDLGNGGSRWIPQLGLYDDRNRFMSPNLGRFLQPDPIGFKGDASNLYRYCHNDWANKIDLTGLEEVTIEFKAFIQQERVTDPFGRTFCGDNRSFSADRNASSRTAVTVVIETDRTKNNGYPIKDIKTTVQPTHKEGAHEEKTSRGPKPPVATASQDKNGNVTVNVQQNMRNPFEIAPAPGIRSNVNITVNEAATNASVKGTVSGTPSFEANFKVADGDTKNVPLQSESKNGFNFGANLFTDSQIQINNIELKPMDTAGDMPKIPTLDQSEQVERR